MKNLSSAQERAAAYALNILENPQKFERKLSKRKSLLFNRQWVTWPTAQP
jgi:hypothetical protein